MLRNLFLSVVVLLLVHVASASAWAQCLSENNGPKDSTLQYTDPNVLVNKPIVAVMDELACYGCISPSTGRIRDGYVTPHFRSNGSFVGGYYRTCSYTTI